MTGHPLGSPLRHSRQVYPIEFSADGSRALTASEDHTARVWDVLTAESIGPPMRHQDVIRDAHFSPDGAWVLTASQDGTARVWPMLSAAPAEASRLASLAEAVAGYRVNEGRAIVPLNDRAGKVAALRTELSASLGQPRSDTERLARRILLPTMPAAAP
jgi:hypothetical protein